MSRHIIIKLLFVKIKQPKTSALHRGKWWSERLDFSSKTGKVGREWNGTSSLKCFKNYSRLLDSVKKYT